MSLRALIYQSVAISVLNYKSKAKSYNSKNAKPYYAKNSVYIFIFFVGVEFIQPETGSMNRTPTFT